MSETNIMLRCETCGGELNYSDDLKSAVCLNCGNEYHFKGEKSEALILALNTANAKRIACDFDGASIDYKAVIGREPDDAEAHWGLVLSTYGIEYVEDPRTKNRIPTCRRTVKASILENEDYLLALNNAAYEQKEIYKEKAAIIDRLQKKIKRQLEDEEEYDVFISFKSTDESGHPTEDRQIARRIYDELTRRGIKTFFSEITLKSRLGEDYEPIIYKALYSCKFFILVATSEENMNSAWVKNEWSRYRDRVFDEALSNAGCAVFKNIKLNELPSFLRGQGIDLVKYPAGGYEIEIADGLSARFGLIKKNEEAEEIKRQLEEQKKLQQSLEDKLKVIESTSHGGESASKTVQSMLVRAKQFAESGEFENAISKIDEVLDVAPTYSEAWVNLFYFKHNTTVEKGLALMGAKLLQEGGTCKEYSDILQYNQRVLDSFKEKYYQNALRYADENQREKLLKYQTDVANTATDIQGKIKAKLVTKGIKFLQKSNWSAADEAFLLVLSIDDKNCYAYLGEFLVEIQAMDLDEAAKKILNLDFKYITKNNNLNNAFDFADEPTKEKLISLKNSTVELMNNEIEEKKAKIEKCNIEKCSAVSEKKQTEDKIKAVEQKLLSQQRIRDKYKKYLSKVHDIEYGEGYLAVSVTISLIIGVITLGFSIFGRETLYNIIPFFDSWFRVWVESNESFLGTAIGFILSAIAMTLIMAVAMFIALGLLRGLSILFFSLPTQSYYRKKMAKYQHYNLNCTHIMRERHALRNDCDRLERKIEKSTSDIEGLTQNIQGCRQRIDYISTAIKGELYE